MTYLQSAMLLIFLVSLAGCGGNSASPSAPTAADLKIGTTGTATGPVGAADVTFPVFAQYSVTGITPNSALNVWERVTPSSVRVVLISASGTPVGSILGTVSLAIKDGSNPQASQFSTGATAVIKDLNGAMIPQAQIAPTFAIDNVR
ncbi:hypothetical protein OR1_00083 [Geobacter sp. OR-1]|uniref:hypothetical protein n=1 Tax=Geobacter sp. OR-1 TaxID=1266765 RepID=UPI0005435B40|nr:hypothetical protein [Geobacter sp. OR-1]GAM07814.1 hypothetical protein OR1_00083 [Geobacter sp. OR-1]